MKPGSEDRARIVAWCEYPEIAKQYVEQGMSLVRDLLSYTTQLEAQVRSQTPQMRSRSGDPPDPTHGVLIPFLTPALMAHVVEVMIGHPPMYPSMLLRCCELRAPDVHAYLVNHCANPTQRAMTTALGCLLRRLAGQDIPVLDRVYRIRVVGFQRGHRYYSVDQVAM